MNPVLVSAAVSPEERTVWGENTRQLISVENMKLLINSTEVPVRTMMLFLAQDWPQARGTDRHGPGRSRPGNG